MADINEVRDYWNNNPLLSHELADVGSAEFFESLEYMKRSDSERFAMDYWEFDKHSGKDVLDIGCGPGWLTVNFARGGANVSSCDLTPTAVELTKKHLELYNQIDIALDTFPYNGTVTTFQSFMMGVAVLSLVGEHHMSRVGLSILKQLDMEFFAARTPDEYVSKAVALAAKPESLDKIRMSMRNRLGASSLCNNLGFAIKVENAYREMWHEYCGRHGVEVTDEKKQLNDRGNTEEASSNVVSDKKVKRGILYVIWGDREKDHKMRPRACACGCCGAGSCYVQPQT